MPHSAHILDKSSLSPLPATVESSPRLSYIDDMRQERMDRLQQMEEHSDALNAGLVLDLTSVLEQQEQQRPPVLEKKVSYRDPFVMPPPLPTTARPQYYTSSPG